jgi:hypothetical protein
MYDPPGPSAREVLIGIGLWIGVLAVLGVVFAGIGTAIVHTLGWS